MIYVGIIFLLCLILMIWVVYKDRAEGYRLGEVEDFLLINLSPKVYTRYNIFYKLREDKYIWINIDSSRKERILTNDIMFLGELKESGKTEVVFYPYGEKRIVVEESIESLTNKINGKS